MLHSIFQYLKVYVSVMQQVRTCKMSMLASLAAVELHHLTVASVKEYTF